MLHLPLPHTCPACNGPHLAVRAELPAAAQVRPYFGTYLGKRGRITSGTYGRGGWTQGAGSAPTYNTDYAVTRDDQPTMYQANAGNGFPGFVTRELGTYLAIFSTAGTGQAQWDQSLRVNGGEVSHRHTDSGGDQFIDGDNVVRYLGQLAPGSYIQTAGAGDDNAGGMPGISGGFFYVVALPGV